MIWTIRASKIDSGNSNILTFQPASLGVRPDSSFDIGCPNVPELVLRKPPSMEGEVLESS